MGYGPLHNYTSHAVRLCLPQSPPPPQRPPPPKPMENIACRLEGSLGERDGGINTGLDCLRSRTCSASRAGTPIISRAPMCSTAPLNVAPNMQDHERKNHGESQTTVCSLMMWQHREIPCLQNSASSPCHTAHHRRFLKAQPRQSCESGRKSK